jgi:hypothetical protein
VILPGSGPVHPQNDLPLVQLTIEEHEESSELLDKICVLAS